MKQTRRRKYWTRERVIEALHRFAREYKVIVTSSEHYARLTANIKRSTTGSRNVYPSFATVLQHFPNFRAAWRACGVKPPRCVNQSREVWTPEEDWFLREAIGILSRKEIAAYLERTEDAVHHKLYELGLNTREARGWSVFRLSRVAGISEVVIRTYQDRGELPYFKGTTSNFMDPADFLCITQIDWTNPPAELAHAVRQSLMQRVAKILSGQDWRKGRIYQVHRKRVTNRRWNGKWVLPPPPPPTELRIDDVVRCERAHGSRTGVVGREGVVKHIYWTPNTKYGERSSLGACWMVRVEFKKLKRHGKDDPRVTYTLPVDAVQKVEMR